MTGLTRICLTALLALTPGWANAWRGINRHEVYPVSDTVFEVLNDVGSGAVDYWCGAGDFARQVMGTPAAQRIYIWRGIGPSATRQGRRSVQFSLTPPPDADTTPGLSLSVKKVGDNMTSALAYQYCLGHDRFDPFFPRGW
ncbi:MAG: hypothetical protein ACI8R4_004347 [Paracoccaceae bacterium]|jgi:hypothetical protein